MRGGNELGYRVFGLRLGTVGREPFCGLGPRKQRLPGDEWKSNKKNTRKLPNHLSSPPTVPHHTHIGQGARISIHSAFDLYDNSHYNISVFWIGRTQFDVPFQTNRYGQLYFHDSFTLIRA